VPNATLVGFPTLALDEGCDAAEEQPIGVTAATYRRSAHVDAGAR